MTDVARMATVGAEVTLPKHSPLTSPLEHVGHYIKTEILEAHGLTQAQLADRIGVHRITVTKLINGRGACTPEMSVRLERLAGTPAAVWMARQAVVDLAAARDQLGDALNEIVPLPRK